MNKEVVFTDEGAVFLFSVDLEDVRLGVDGGTKYKDSIPELVPKYLQWLEAHDCQCTFFVTGDVAERHPAIIAEIAKLGHEIGAHTTRHLPLSQLGPEAFKSDLQRNKELLEFAGADNVVGFRAPSYSLTAETQWAYDILAELGFTYSSSVLPAKNPLFGWPEFGTEPTLVNNKIVEIPITTFNLGPMNLPLAGGIYFRVIPFIITKHLITKRLKCGTPVIGYFHPYDIDEKQERFMHGGINKNRFYNLLMYLNRGRVLPRLSKIMKMGFKIAPYNEFVNKRLNTGELRVYKTYS